MEKQRAIPQGHMTIGEIAKLMDITTRTLQHYDKEGVLSPTSESKGGFRLYTHKDVITLFQIKSMQNSGYSLKEIKSRLPTFETPKDVSNALAEQAKEIQERLKTLKDVLVSIEELKKEAEQMETIDWAKYADAALALQARMTYVTMRRQAIKNQNGGN